jgi:hypothetical protein
MHRIQWTENRLVIIARRLDCDPGRWTGERVKRYINVIRTVDLWRYGKPTWWNVTKPPLSDWTEAKEVLGYFIGLCVLSPVSFRSLQAHLQMPVRHSTLLIRVLSFFFFFFKKFDEGHGKNYIQLGWWNNNSLWEWLWSLSEVKDVQ